MCCGWSAWLRRWRSVLLLLFTGGHVMRGNEWFTGFFVGAWCSLVIGVLFGVFFGWAALWGWLAVSYVCGFGCIATAVLVRRGRLRW